MIFDELTEFCDATSGAISNIVGNIIGSHFALRKGAKFIRPMMLVVLVLLLGKLFTDML